MSVHFLVYVDGDRAPPFDWPSCMTRADQVVGMFGWNIIYVDPAGHLKRTASFNPMICGSLTEAQGRAELVGRRWVWMHPKATDTLQGYKHPADDVIYCVGSDYTGLDEKQPGELVGDALRIWTPDPNREYYAETVVHLVVYDRALKTLGP